MKKRDISADIADMQNGQMRTVEIEDKHQVLISKIDGELFAIYGKCSHYGAPLSKGAMSGNRVVCPWHHACFDAKTGIQIEGPGVESLPAYEISQADGKTYLHLPDTIETTCPAHLSKKENGADEIYIIVGGGAAGLYAAEGMRRADFAGKIVMLTKEDALPYDRTKASKAYLQGAAGDDGMPLLQTDFYEKYDIDLRQNAEVKSLAADAKTVTLADGKTLKYDKILVAVGGTPRRLEVQGADLPGVHTLRTWADSKVIREAAKSAKNAVVIGGSFIGLEAAQALQKHGCAVTVVTPEAIPFAKIFGEEIGKHILKLHKDAGVEFRLQDKAAAILGEDKVKSVKLNSGEMLSADLVVIGIGVTPATDWLPDNLRDEKGAVETDENLRVANDIYAAGDVAKFPLHGKKVRIEHWKVACDQGRCVGQIMAGAAVGYHAVPFFWSAQQGKNFRYVGHAENFDEVYIDGEVSANNFLAYYAEGGEILAVLGVGRDPEVAALQELMYENEMPSLAEVKGDRSVKV